jgi:TolB-like protein/Tfp pilus assembly protein PilF
MTSLISDFEYDIFISYRQKDNEYDGWITEFVNNLKRELHATFKEDISIYFDANPIDGLLETHIVDESLAKKLKCLILIPVISQTYCDPQSFAWQHEFCAFNKLAKEDQFGRDICLAGGNVASRILPVKIHDLDPEDSALLENELGGILRSVDFIYKSAGVNRPLTPSDNPDKNLNKTFYRDQINKVANSVKEIITAIKKHNQQDGKVLKEVVKAEHELSKNLKPKIIIGSLLVLVLIALGYLFIPKLFSPSKPVEKSIAVLPFKSLSDDPEKQYLADGMMDAILLHLSKIEDLRVMSRTSVEQYRKTDKASNVIGQELGVAYLLEGSFQKYGDNARLIVQLIKTGKEGHVWAKDYDRNWNDVFSVQSEVAQTITRELHAVITPEEKQLIEKTPTANLTAYDFYQRGREEHTKYWINNSNKAVLQKAEDLYRKALKYDSTYAQAYTGLARVYWDTHSSAKEYFSENYMDSVLILSDIALSFDNKLAEAYTIRGDYYTYKGIINKALDEYNKSIKLNPNSWVAYYGKGYMYMGDDLLNSIDNFQKAASRNHGLQLPVLLRDISYEYSSAGFMDKAKNYNLEALKLDGDSILYLDDLGFYEIRQGNFEKALEFLQKGYAMDSTNQDIVVDLGQCNMFLNQFKESLKYYKKYVEMLKGLGTFTNNTMHRIGLSYWGNGYKKEAEYYFDKQLEYCKNDIELKRPWGQRLYPYYDMAGIHAFRGDKEKAYKFLNLFDQRKSMPLWVVTYIKNYSSLSEMNRSFNRLSGIQKPNTRLSTSV